MNVVRIISRWIMSNPLIALAGALTTVFGLIISASNVIPVILRALNRPDCLTYANVYHDPWSDFRREGDLWREYRRTDGHLMFEFRELHRTRDDIDLLNLTPRPEIPNWETMIVRIPVCGGTAKATTGVAQHWDDLYQIWRD